MQGLMVPAAEQMAAIAAQGAGKTLKTLDIAAGHGLFGIAVAKHCPQAQIVAVDWAGVLTVAEENARAAGVADRHTLLPGSAFEADFGTEYDLALLTNFFHHFDSPTNVALMRRVRQAMRPGGRVMTLEFIPNEDRVSPPDQAMFGVIMLANTPQGDVYTFNEYDAMLREAGFGDSRLMELEAAPQRLIVTAA
jgi:ubiquinone/menaquinone biosynthesis C-methylase UbiE